MTFYDTSALSGFALQSYVRGGVICGAMSLLCYDAMFTLLSEMSIFWLTRLR